MWRIDWKEMFYFKVVVDRHSMQIWEVDTGDAWKLTKRVFTSVLCAYTSVCTDPHLICVFCLTKIQCKPQLLLPTRYKKKNHYITDERIKTDWEQRHWRVDHYNLLLYIRVWYCPIADDGWTRWFWLYK
jgi:hypothetical protein